MKISKPTKPVTYRITYRNPYRNRNYFFISTYHFPLIQVITHFFQVITHFFHLSTYPSSHHLSTLLFHSSSKVRNHPLFHSFTFSLIEIWENESQSQKSKVKVIKKVIIEIIHFEKISHRKKKVIKSSSKSHQFRKTVKEKKNCEKEKIISQRKREKVKVKKIVKKSK